MKNTALMIIDTQLALFNNPDTPLYKESGIIEIIQGLISKARISNTPIIFIQHTTLEGDFKRHTQSWQIHPAIAPSSKDTIIEKTSWDAFYQTALEETLTSLNITHLVVSGMQTEYCLDTTLRCGYSKDYQFTVIENGHSTMSSTLDAVDIINHHNAIWRGRFATVTHSKDFEF